MSVLLVSSDLACMSSVAGAAASVGAELRTALSLEMAFGPHVHTGLLAAAREAGCDRVVARGEFHARLDDYLPQPA